MMAYFWTLNPLAHCLVLMKNKCPIRLGVGPQSPQQKQPKSAFRSFAIQHFIGSSWIWSPGCTVADSVRVSKDKINFQIKLQIFVGSDYWLINGNDKAKMKLPDKLVDYTFLSDDFRIRTRHRQQILGDPINMEITLFSANQAVDGRHIQMNRWNMERRNHFWWNLSQVVT